MSRCSGHSLIARLIWINTCVCVCVCVRERERASERDRDRDRETERARARERERLVSLDVHCDTNIQEHTPILSLSL